MKKAIINIKINVPDDFECGDCEKCPLAIESYYDNHYIAETRISCPLEFNKSTCPLEV